jgi:hypothetical protein
MRKIRDVLRLTYALGMSRRLVGEATGIGKTAVGEYVRRAAVAGLVWPIISPVSGSTASTADWSRDCHRFDTGGALELIGSIFCRWINTR